MDTTDEDNEEDGGGDAVDGTATAGVASASIVSILLISELSGRGRSNVMKSGSGSRFVGETLSIFFTKRQNVYRD